MKLKLWVKIALFILIMSVICMINHKQYSDAIDSCIKSGHSQQYCENGIN